MTNVIVKKIKMLKAVIQINIKLQFFFLKIVVRTGRESVAALRFLLFKNGALPNEITDIKQSKC